MLSYEGWEGCIERKKIGRGVPSDGHVGNGVKERRQ